MAETITIRTGAATEVIKVIEAGPQGPAGSNGANGQGVPIGGTTGQILRKASGTNYDTEWATGGGGGGVSSWNDLTDKPATFPPSSHTHPISEVTNLQTSLDGKAATSDARLSDSREWSASTIDQAEAEAGTATTRRAFTALRVFQAIAAWWAGSSAKTKLDGIASGATANATDAQLRDRSTHTGTQAANTITGLAAIATSGSASDLANNPTLVGDVVVNGSSPGVSGTLKVGVTTGSFARDVELNGDGVVLRNQGSSGTITIARGSGGTSSYTLTPPSASGTLALQGAITTSGLTQSTARILGRTTASAGAVEEITVGSGLSLSAGELSATASGGVTAVGASTADVLSVSGSNLVADDGGTIDSADPFIKWDDAAGKLVYANPLSRPTGAMYIGLAPTTTALGSNAVNIQTGRAAATRVAAGSGAVAIGNTSIASGTGGVSIGDGASSGSGNYGIAIGGLANAASGNQGCIAIGGSSASTVAGSIAIGQSSTASAQGAFALGQSSTASAVFAYAAGQSVTANLRAQFVSSAFSSVYWSGQTTNTTATILNLDGAATNRFTIAASTALAVDILLVARRATTQDKWLVARRFLGIRRDGSNNTALIGSVQTLGTDQSAGSPTWTFSLTADDTNEALQLEVTGATGETVEWRATAFYRVA